MAPTKPTPKTQHTHDFTEMVVVKVGESKKKFLAHKTFLTKSSKFFQVAMQKHWAEGETKIVELPEIKADAFASYLHWLYTGTLAESDDGSLQNQKNAKTREERMEMADLYGALCDIAILADVVDESRLRDAVVDAFLLTRSNLSVYPGSVEIEMLWTNLPPTSKLRLMLTDYYAASSNSKLFETQEHSERLPSEFLLGVLVAMKKEKKGGHTVSSPKFFNRCRYHEHAEEDTCK